MSFKGFDRQTYIVDSAKAFGSRQITKREFLRRMGIAGIGFSGFAAGLLGNTRRRGGLLSSAQAADITLPDDQVKFLKEVGGKYKGATVRYTSEATPPTVVLNQIKDQFTALTGINVEVEIVPLEQVLAKATQDVQGQLGTYDLYYLDQSWVATFSQDCIDPIQYTKDKPDLAMPGFDWDDFSKPLVEGLAKYEGKMVGVPFDIPIFILMYRQDIWRSTGSRCRPTTPSSPRRSRRSPQAEKANNMFGTGLQAKSGHYSLECDWTQAVWGHGGGIFGADKHFTGNDEAGIKGLQWYQNLLKNAPAASTTSTWDGQFQMMAAGPVRAGAELGRVLPRPRRRRFQGEGPLAAGEAAAVGSGPARDRQGRLRRNPEPRPPGRLDHGPLAVLEEPGSRLDLHAVGLLERDHDPVHPRRRLRADASVVLRGSAREGEGEGRCRHHPSPRYGAVDDRQRDGLGAGYAALGRLFQQRDPDRTRQAADRSGLWRRRQEVHGRGGGHDRCQN
jgi:hypothetical protein